MNRRGVNRQPKTDDAWGRKADGQRRGGINRANRLSPTLRSEIAAHGGRIKAQRAKERKDREAAAAAAKLKEDVAKILAGFADLAALKNETEKMRRDPIAARARGARVRAQRQLKEETR